MLRSFIGLWRPVKDTNVSSVLSTPRQVNIGCSYLGVGMRDVLIFWIRGLDEFENLSDDHSDQANTGSCKERNPKSYIVHSHLGDRVKHAQANVSPSESDVKRIRLTCHVDIAAGCEK